MKVKNLKQIIFSAVKIAKDPMIDHLDELVKAIPGIVGVAVVLTKLASSIGDSVNEKIKPAADILESLDKDDLTEEERAEKKKKLEEMKNKNPEIKVFLKDFGQEMAVETIDKANLTKGDIALASGLFLQFSDGINKDDVLKKMDLILLNSSDELAETADEEKASGDYKNALDVIGRFLDEKYDGYIDIEDEPRPAETYYGYKYEITDDGFCFNFNDDVSEADPDEMEDIAFFGKVYDAVNYICSKDMDGKKCFSHYFLFGFTKEELLYFQEDFDDEEYDEDEE
ncbi:MAG: hypothetical protein K6G22_13510 [Lachnospiraceae bacterium]|nr:hypothetical protein [Lachnospiraceae bacterium]